MKFTSMFFTASAGIFGIYPKYITNERDKQSLLCYFKASAAYIRGLPQIYNKRAR